MAIGEIIAITIVTQQGTKDYYIGKPIDGGYFPDGVNGRTVSKIYCGTDSGTPMYHVYDADGDLIASIENCPVDVMYAKPKPEAGL